MSRYFILIVSIIPLVCGLWAAETFAADESLCSLVKPPYEKVIPLSGDRGRTYWSQTFEYPEGSGKYYLTSTEYGGAGGDNTMLDLQTGRIRPGGKYRLDPFPSPDGRFLTHPGLSIYDMVEVMSQGESAEPRWGVDNGAGDYQSVGLLSKEGISIDSPRIYRAVIRDGLMGIDFRVTFKPGTQQPESFKPLRRTLKRLCENLTTIDTSTPIVSKDGKYLSVSSTSVAGGHHILEIKPDRTCVEVRAIGGRTSKGNFSFDSKYVAFQEQVASQSPTDPNFYSRAIMVDIASGERFDLLPTMTNREVVGYPTFRADGKVVLQVIRKGVGTSSQTRDLVIVSIDELKAWYRERDQRTADARAKLQQFEAACTSCRTTLLDQFAKTWETICRSNLLVADKPLELLANLNPAECRALVDKYWNGNRNPLDTGVITEESVLALCPTERLRTGAIGAGPGWLAEVSESRTVAQVFQEKCAGCHMAGSPAGFIPFTDRAGLQELKNGKTWIQRIREWTSPQDGTPPRMPMGGSLDAADKQLMDTYLQGME